MLRSVDTDERAGSGDVPDRPPESVRGDEPPAGIAAPLERTPDAETPPPLGRRQRWVRESLFDPEHYRRESGLWSDEPDALFAHYLDVGLPADLSPSPLFDPAHVRAVLEERATALAADDPDEDADARLEAARARPLMLAWLDEEDRFAPNAWFDERFYRENCPQLVPGRDDPFLHFVTTGLDEDRIPCRPLAELKAEFTRQFPTLRFRVRELLESCPAAGLGDLLGAPAESELRRFFMPVVYRRSLDRTVAAGATDAALLAHFLVVGWREERRPSALFHERWYRTLVAREHALEPIDGRVPYLHWLYVGREAGLIPTPLFDAAHYLEAHEDIRRSRRFAARPFDHFLIHGVNELNRLPSVRFSNAHYRQQVGKLEHKSPIVDYLLRGQYRDVSPVKGLDVARFARAKSWSDSPAESAAIAILERLHALEQEPLAGMLERCERLEPQIVRPYGPCDVRMPPMVHPAVPQVLDARAISANLEKLRYDTIVLLPHCRMAGSAKISGTLVRTLANIGGAERVLMITTDLDVFERAEWFPEEVDLLDVSAPLASATHERRVLALLDLVRGLRPRRLLNVNSNLGWHLTREYGKQLSEWMDLYFYLFCWDLDKKGNKGGYPIQWFLPTFDYCSAVFTDNETLRRELVDRYALSASRARSIVTLYQPASDVGVQYGRAIAERALHRGRRRVFWCGRFDRQKRMDLLFAIAEKMPEIEFCVWGKAVMNDDVDPREASDNIRFMGAYAHVDDMSISSCDCFLYTSGWDGLPVVLIEMGSRNVPVVASDVGGVSELITEETGWLVSDAENVDAYVGAIEEVLADPERALERAGRLRQRTLEQCSTERYEAMVAEVLGREDEVRLPRDVHVVGAVTADAPSSDSGAVATESRASAPDVDVSAILTAHAEGSLAAVSARSLLEACEHAENAGLSVEKLLVLDRPDRRTLRVFEDIGERMSVLVTDFGDQGLARNHAVTQARGEFVAFLDGDDLWGDSWLTEACRFLRQSPDDTIAHPEFARFFGEVSSIFVNIDQDDPAFNLSFLRHGNYWDAMCMARRATHLAFPYSKRRIADGFALEDWHWNCETIAAGQRHKVVPGTVHFKRRRESSQTMQASRSRSLMPATPMTGLEYLRNEGTRRDGARPSSAR